MSTSNEFLLVASDDSFELNNGKLLDTESTDKIQTVRLFDLDKNLEFSVYVLLNECDLEVCQEGTKISVQCSNRKNFTWDEFYKGVDD